MPSLDRRDLLEPGRLIVATRPDTHPLNLARVVVVGVSGSGKSTFARQLAHRVRAPHVELDAFIQRAEWSTLPLAAFQEHIEPVIKRSSWVVDGNYFDHTLDTVWKRATAVVWLDYSLTVFLPRLVRRSFRRIITREELWNGNREGWSALLGRESVVVWALGSRHRIREVLTSAEFSDIRPPVIRLTSPKAAKIWMARITTIEAEEAVG